MKILITGGCGFIGSNFLNKMVIKYPHYFFVNIDAMYYCASHENINKEIRNAANYKFIKGNIENTELIDFILNEYEIDVIIHFAAQSHVDTSFSTPIQYTLDNVLGTHKLLECVRNYGKINLFIHVSTDEVYGESENEMMTEKSILCPTNPYAATKAAAEMILKSYEISFKIPIIITRGNNVYGPNQYYEKLIPKFENLLKNKQKVTIHGKGDAKRSFIHVDDVISAFDIILHKGIIGEIYNIGSDPINEKTVMEVAEILINKYYPNDPIEKWIEYVDDRNFNDKRYFISSEKLRMLGWKPIINFKLT